MFNFYFRDVISHISIPQMQIKEPVRWLAAELSRKARKTIFTVFQYPTIGHQPARLIQPNAPLKIHFIAGLHNSPPALASVPRCKFSPKKERERKILRGKRKTSAQRVIEELRSKKGASSVQVLYVSLLHAYIEANSSRASLRTGGRRNG